MEAKTLGEIVLPLETFPYIPYWFTLRQALAEMEDIETTRSSDKYRPWIILVFDAQNHLLGIVQRQNILRGMRSGIHDKIGGIYPSFDSSPVDPDLSRLSFSQERAIQELQSQFERQIIEFITPIKLTADINDPILFAIYLMIDHDLTFIAVTKDNEIVGIVYIEDALQEIISEIVE